MAKTDIEVTLEMLKKYVDGQKVKRHGNEKSDTN